MYIQKSIQLTTAPLNDLILRGQALDFRLDEERWRDLEVGHCIEFWEDFTGRQAKPRSQSRRVIARIVHLYRAPTFTHLFERIAIDMDWIEDLGNLLAELRDWWSIEMEAELGVLAFHVMVEKD